MADESDWRETNEALQRLEHLLKCSLCKQIIVDPRSLYTCDHHFCRKCLSKGNVSRCPTCDVPAWTKDLKSNQQIDNIVQLAATIRHCISAAEPTDPCPEVCSTIAPICGGTRNDPCVKEPASAKGFSADVISSPWKRDRKHSLDDGVAANKVVESTYCKQQHHTGGLLQTPNQSALAKLRKRNTKGETPLHLAAMKGDTVAVAALIEQGADCRAKDNAGWTPLHEACNFGHLETVRILLSHGVSVNIQGFENNLPIHDAVINNHTEVAVLLMSSGANPNARNSNGLTSLDLASTEAMRKVLTMSTAQTPPVPAMVVLPPVDEGVCTPNKKVTPKASSKLVMLVTGLKGDEKVQLQELAKILRGEVVASFSPHVTHVIAPCNSLGCCARTLKALCGIAMGKWILSFDWVRESVKSGYQHEESLYEVKGFVVQETSKVTNAPQMSRDNAGLQKPGLFAGCSFYFHGSFLPPSLTKNDITSLVTYAGGNVLRKPPSKPVPACARPFHASPGSMFESCHVFIVHDTSSYQSHVPTVVGVANVPMSWILDSLSSFQLLQLPV